MNFKTLPYYKALDSEDSWFALLPEIIINQHQWIILNGIKLNLSNDLLPYFKVGVSLWERAINLAGISNGYPAIYMFRPILERIALLWASSAEIGFDINSIIRTYQNGGRTLRSKTTERILEQASKKDPTIGILYSTLSRYFNHLSYLDTIFQNTNPKINPTYEKRIEIIPLMLLFDIGLCFQNVISQLLSERSISIPEFVGGRNGQYYPLDYIRLCQHLFTDNYTESKAIEARVLLNGNTKGDSVGITKIWRGGMEMFRYGDPKDKPEMKTLHEWGIMALGPIYSNKKVRIHHRKDGTKGEKYEFTWPKEFELSSSIIGLTAGHYKNGHLSTLEYIDYVSIFLDLITPENKGELFDNFDFTPKKKSKIGKILRSIAEWFDKTFGK